MVTFHAGDVIASTGDEPNGLFVIITGMVKITYEPIGEFIKVKVSNKLFHRNFDST